MKGYFLLFEGMLDSVLSARDKWLADDGVMAPSCTKILLSAFGDPEWYNDTVNFWNDVYGFKMNTMRIDYKSNALVTVVNGDKLISNSVVISDIDTKSVIVPKLDFETTFELDISETGKIYAFCGWFDTYFEGKGIDSVMFSTSPMTKATHWMQTLFILEHPLVVSQNDKIVGKFYCKKSATNPRELDVLIEYQIYGQDVLNKQHFSVV
jgi:protein arginine N-methyltransferase 3